MAKKAQKHAVKKGSKKGSTKGAASFLSDPATHAMIARAGGCNKPPIQWLQQADGSWMECFLRSDCTYGNCNPVDASDVPPQIRNGSKSATSS
jgi:hypothetical protein